MDRILPHNIQVVITYDDADVKFHPQTLINAVNSMIPAEEMHFQRVAFEKVPEYLHFFGGNTSIQIDQSDNPISHAGFAEALGSQVTALFNPEVAAAIKRHRKHTFVTITNGVPMPDMSYLRKKANNSAMNDVLNGLQRPFKPDHYEFAIKLLKVIGGLYCKDGSATAVHWCQSNQLLSRQRFMSVVTDDQDLTLRVHPVRFGSGKSVNGSNCIGLRTFGAKTLIGREILFDESPINFIMLYQRALQFIAMAQASGSVIPHNDSFGIDNTEIIRVRHLADEYDPAGIFKLTLERCAALDKLLAVGEVDRSRSAERRALADEAVRGLDVEKADAHVTRSSIAQGKGGETATRSGLAGLREIARRGQGQDAPGSTAQPVKRSLFGLFSRK